MNVEVCGVDDIRSVTTMPNIKLEKGIGNVTLFDIATWFTQPTTNCVLTYSIENTPMFPNLVWLEGTNLVA